MPLHLPRRSLTALAIFATLALFASCFLFPPGASVSITSHSSGDTVSGSVAFSGGFTGEVDAVNLAWAGLNATAALNETALTWSASLDSTALPDGSATLVVTAVAAGEAVAEISVSLTVDNAAAAAALAASPGWEQDAVFYHIWVKAFANTAGDGTVTDGHVGTIAGIRSKLDYLNDGNPATTEDLGVTALWLSPIFECASKGTDADFNMHGYDTTDYYSINSYFGSKEDLHALLLAAHQRGIRVIFDFVPNHSSNSHPWFTDSASQLNGKADWYVWEAADPGWDVWGDTWYLNADRGAWYYGIFHETMPDLNYRNAEVVAEMKKVAKYWLDAGFDGMRIDAIPYLFEDGSTYANLDETHAFYQALRADVLNPLAAAGYAKMMVGEAWQGYGEALSWGPLPDSEPEFDMNFDFGFRGLVDAAITSAGGAAELGELSTRFEQMADGQASGYTLASFLSNHDEVADRVMTSHANANIAKAAASLNILGTRTPFLYYGEELGQEDAALSGDIRHRQPISWAERDAQAADADSILSWYRYLLRAKNSYPALRTGSYDRLSSDAPGVLAWLRKSGNQEVVVAINLSGAPADASISLGSASSYSGTVSVILGSAEGLSAVSSGALALNALPAWSTRIIVLAAGEPVISAEDHAIFVAPTLTLLYAPSDATPPDSLPLTTSLSSGGATLRDDGLAPDETADDGVYTGTITFNASGASTATLDGHTLDLGMIAEGSSTVTDIYYETYSDWVQPIYLRGSMNGWGGTLMDYQGNGAWSLDQYLSAGSHAFKFCENSGSPWLLNWGDAAPADGIADPYGADISFSAPSAGTYVFSFDTDSLSYSVSGP